MRADAGVEWLTANVYGYGAFIRQGGGTKNTSSGSSNRTDQGFDFNASRSSAIYKDSATTVVPESLITNFYIKY